jgi:hypothetical protein
MLNAIFGDTVTGIDAVVKAVSDVADAALAASGGAFTGEITVLTAIYTQSNLGNMSGTASLDLDVANCFYGTVTGAVTISFANVPASGSFVFVVFEITNGGSATVSWPAAIKWPGGAAPSLTASGTDLITLYSRDGGTTWRATLALENTT